MLLGPDDRHGVGGEMKTLAVRGWLVLACALFLSVPAAPAQTGGDEADWQQWREQREKSLTAEESWTSLVGLHWLDGSRVTRVGSDPDNDVVLANVPGHLGRIVHHDGQWRFEPATDVEVTVAGVATVEPVTLADDASGADDAVAPARVRHGPVSFMVIQRGDRVALRVWDRSSPARLGFAGLDFFPWSPDWRVQAIWEAHDPVRSVDIVDVTGHTQALRNPGAIRFRHGDSEFRLEALQENDGDDLFLIFADRSNRTSTYGAGRYLYTHAPDTDGVVMVDFNRAFNPPCAFSAYATCPLPPPENRLDLAVAAGERRYPVTH